VTYLSQSSIRPSKMVFLLFCYLRIFDTKMGLRIYSVFYVKIDVIKVRTNAVDRLLQGTKIIKHVS